MAQEQLGALPKPTKNLDGVSHAKGNQYEIEVSNRNGYLSHIQVRAAFDVPPEDIFAIFTHTDNSHLFRDIKGVAGRKVVKQEGGLKVVELEQLGELRVLWITRTFSTFLEVIEDQRDPSNLLVEFILLKSDVLAKFNGKWILKPKVDPSTGKVTTDSILEQDILPKGVPPMMKHIPIVGGLIRGVSVRAVQRIIEDVQAAVQKLTDGMSLEELLNPNGKPKEAGVASFAIDDDSDADAEGNQAVSAPQGHPVKVKLDVSEDGKITLGLSTTETNL